MNKIKNYFPAVVNFYFIHQKHKCTYLKIQVVEIRGSSVRVTDRMLLRNNMVTYNIMMLVI